MYLYVQHSYPSSTARHLHWTMNFDFKNIFDPTELLWTPLIIIFWIRKSKVAHFIISFPTPVYMDSRVVL